jgi:DNA-binding transcriptional MerR regulator
MRLRPVDVAREFHRTSDWLRYLEREGVIPQARRDFRGFRYYEPADVEAIRRIVLKSDDAGGVAVG